MLKCNDKRFEILFAEEVPAEITVGTGTSDSYQKVKTYLNVKEQLKQLEATLERKEQQLKTDNEEIKRLADDIRKQAQEALIT